MYRFKQSLLAFAVVSAVALLIPQTGRGQKAGSPAPLNVRDVDNPARQPFQATFRIPFSQPSDGAVEVPAGKRLVIEFASIDVGVDPTCRVAALSINTRAGGVPAPYYIPTTHIAGTNRNVDIAAQQMRLYADPGTQVSVNYPTIGSNCDHAGFISFSGYLVDVAPAQ